MPICLVIVGREISRAYRFRGLLQNREILFTRSRKINTREFHLAEPDFVMCENLNPQKFLTLHVQYQCINVVMEDSHFFSILTREEKLYSWKFHCTKFLWSHS